jgi:hypothetical protein
MDGATQLATDTLNASSQASFTPAFGVGSYSITAVYSGDGNFTGSPSPAVIQIVNN